MKKLQLFDFKASQNNRSYHLIPRPIAKVHMKYYLSRLVLVLPIILLTISFQSSLAQVSEPAAPQTITDLVVVPGNGEVRLSWTAPFDNGAPITSYKVVTWKTGSDVITTYPNLGTSTSTTITELTNGVSYSFMIYAVNSVGTSAESNVATAKPVTSASTAPRPITDLITLSRDGNARLIWTAPFDNGTPITSYKVVMWKTGSDVITTYPNLGTSTATTIKELTNGVSYSFKVYAVNSAGTSADSNVAIAKPVASAPSTDVPNRINDLVVTRDNGKVNLSWSKPNSNGDPLTSYVVTYWQVGTDNFVKKTLAADATKAQITNLTNGISYVFKINAKNGIGTSPDSNFDSATPSKSTTASVPNQVRKVIATPSSGQVVLSWIEPSDNGAFISSYVVIVSELGTNVFTTYPNLPDSTQTIITGLTNGKTYQFTVSAVNSVGIGKASDPITATPNNRNPIMVSNLRATPGDESVILTWSVSASNLDKISGYRIRVYEGGSNSFVPYTVLGKTTSFTLDGLKNGVPYGFRVIVMADGLGPDSKLILATPSASVPFPTNTPSKITDLKAVVGDSKVTLSWTPPNNGGSAINQYHIIQSKANTNSFTTIFYSGSTKNMVISGLQNDITYNFKVQAKNSAGLGQESNTVSVIPKSSTPQPVLPEWIKITAQWWAEGKISNLEYTQSIEWLINQGIIRLE